MSEKFWADIYRCSKREGMYLYVKKGASLEDLPESLRILSGKLHAAMTLELNIQTKLASAKAETVLENIAKKGFYLQMPPTLDEAYMQQIPNAKL